MYVFPFRLWLVIWVVRTFPGIPLQFVGFFDVFLAVVFVRERERIMRSRNVVRLVKQEGRSRGKCMRFLCNGDLRARAARVYDASNIKEEISSTSDRKKSPTVAP